eukprot:3955979-Karenia_brevis.AAC.1
MPVRLNDFRDPFVFAFKREALRANDGSKVWCVICMHSLNLRAVCRVPNGGKMIGEQHWFRGLAKIDGQFCKMELDLAMK